MAEIKKRIIKPQPGYQMLALSSPADIVIGGGAAGSGKTFTLLIDPLRYIHIPNFGCVTFRRTSPQIRAEGGLWDASQKIYPLLGNATGRETLLEWSFPKNVTIKFSHLQHEKNKYDWMGSEIPFINFDELTHFSSSMFFYLLTRNRSTCGIKPCIRATCNPDPDSWVADMVSWYIGDNGFPIPERRGKIRYFYKDGDTIIWGNTPKECIDKSWHSLSYLVKESKIPAEKLIKSFSFIGGSIFENKALLSANPEYLANLASQDEDTKNQLLKGNWKVSINPKDVYSYNRFRDFFTNTWVPEGRKCITIDAAMEGSNKLIISYFSGNRWLDVTVIDKNTGKELIEAVQAMQNKWRVPNSNVVYDADGAGAFIGGDHNAYIPGAVAFKNGSRPLYNPGDTRSFRNLKSQCYVMDGEYAEQFISPTVANTMYDDKMTVRQRLMFERKAIKKKEKRDEEPEQVISKQEMKEKYLNGDSPDLMDSLMMKRVLDLRDNDITIEVS